MYATAHHYFHIIHDSDKCEQFPFVHVHFHRIYQNVSD